MVHIVCDVLPCDFSGGAAIAVSDGAAIAVSAVASCETRLELDDVFCRSLQARTQIYKYHISRP